MDFVCGLAEKFEQVRATMATEPQRRVGKRSQHAKSGKNLVLELSSYMLSLVESIGQCLFGRNLTLTFEQVRAPGSSSKFERPCQPRARGGSARGLNLPNVVRT